MIKVLFMLDCDLCGYPFEKATSSCDPDPMVWRAVASDLEWIAQQDGWDLHRKGFTCSDCQLQGIMAMQKQPN